MQEIFGNESSQARGFTDRDSEIDYLAAFYDKVFEETVVDVHMSSKPKHKKKSRHGDDVAKARHDKYARQSLSFENSEGE